jgi:hypothetical protein
MNKSNRHRDRISVSIGLINKIKMGRNGAVQYEILYRDQWGREHTQWSDWMRFDEYKIGDSIPVKTASVQGTFGLLTYMKEVNGHPQKRVEPYVATMALACVGTLIAGYYIGKGKTKT